jgi:hypothetical protein
VCTDIGVHDKSAALPFRGKKEKNMQPDASHSEFSQIVKNAES